MSDTGGTPQRLTLSRIVEMLLTRGGERSSVTLSRTAAGETVIDVKVRTGDDDDVATLEQASLKAQTEYDRLRQMYPHSGDHDGADITLTRNAKGETQVSVSTKTSTLTPDVDLLGGVVQKEYDRLRSAYPMADGTTAKAGTVNPGGTS